MSEEVVGKALAVLPEGLTICGCEKFLRMPSYYREQELLGRTFYATSFIRVNPCLKKMRELKSFKVGGKFTIKKLYSLVDCEKRSHIASAVVLFNLPLRTVSDKIFEECVQVIESGFPQINCGVPVDISADFIEQNIIYRFIPKMIFDQLLPQLLPWQPGREDVLALYGRFKKLDYMFFDIVLNTKASVEEVLRVADLDAPNNLGWHSLNVENQEAREYAIRALEETVGEAPICVDGGFFGNTPLFGSLTRNSILGAQLLVRKSFDRRCLQFYGYLFYLVHKNDLDKLGHLLNVGFRDENIFTYTQLCGMAETGELNDWVFASDRGPYSFYENNTLPFAVICREIEKRAGSGFLKKFLLAALNELNVKSLTAYRMLRFLKNVEEYAEMPIAWGLGVFLKNART